ncbi:MAG: NAD dependent epimerase/dehydratase family enzyme, partial [Reinekea sp.]
MHIIIAGATGLIGQSLLNYLNEDQCDKVTALTRRDITLPFKHQNVAIIDYDELTLESATD